MAKTAEVKENTIIFWQGWNDDGPGEPAISIETYSNSVELTQEDNIISISRHELKNLIRELKKIPNP